MFVCAALHGSLWVYSVGSPPPPSAYKDSVLPTKRNERNSEIKIIQDQNSTNAWKGENRDRGGREGGRQWRREGGGWMETQMLQH